MNIDDILLQLATGSETERYLAAHHLSKAPCTGALPALLKAKQIETDRYTLARINLAITKCTFVMDKETDREGISAPSEEETQHIRTQATEHVSGILLHEIGSKIGLIALSAQSEIDNFKESNTARYISNLQDIFDGIEQLRKASQPAHAEQFDLADLIAEVAGNDAHVQISLVGMRPHIVNSCRQFILLALENGVRNAIDAVNLSQFKAGGGSQIVINWGTTDKAHWVSIVDQGPGLQGTKYSFFDLGKTTKKGHAGFGLAIAKQAIERIGGEVSLSPSPAGGAKFEIRWPI